MPTGRPPPRRSQSVRTARGRGPSDTRAGKLEGRARGQGAGPGGWDGTCGPWLEAGAERRMSHRRVRLSYGWGARDHRPGVWDDWKDGSPDRHVPCAGTGTPSGISGSCEGPPMLGHISETS